MALALLAGSGDLPKAILKNLLKTEQKFLLISLQDEVDEELTALALVYNIDNISIVISEIGKLIKTLQQYNIKQIILAGGVSVRPSLRDLKFDKYSFKIFQHLLVALKKGDDILLRAFIKLLESYNIEVVEAQKIVPELLASSETNLVKSAISEKQKIDIKAACEALCLISPLDLGQAAVAVEGRIVALEGPEGTDAMLRRVAELRELGKICGHGGALVKISKRQQDKRVDLPTIGPNTIEQAHRAGLEIIALEHEASFILDEENCAKLLKAYNMVVHTIEVAKICGH